MLKLLDSLGISGRGVTAIVGGGGKTSLMFRLAEELASAGECAVATTTTRIYPPEDPEIYLLSGREDFSAIAQKGKVYCVGRPGMDGKLHYPGDECFEMLMAHSYRVFVEADGSRHLPAKAPNEHEPVIPAEADSFIAVSGMDAPGGRICDVCFRHELACAILDAKPEDILSPEMLAKLIMSENGQHKGIPQGAKFSVVLNKADSVERLAMAEAVASSIKDLSPECKVLITALAQRDCIKAIYE